MNERIENKLRDIAAERRIEILFASEAGSRCCGWDRVDGTSDYDVRFIYAEPRRYYFSLAEKPHAITLESASDGLDFQGLELRHALKLIANSNPNLLEQIFSPIVWKADYAADFQRLAEAHFKKTASFYHYLSMAKGNWKDWERSFAYAGQGEIKPLKKMMVVVRAVLLMIAVQDEGFKYTERFGKDGPYELAKKYMTSQEQLAFHACVLARRSIAEREPAQEETLARWVSSKLNTLQFIPPPKGDARNLNDLEAFFMAVVLY